MSKLARLLVVAGLSTGLVVAGTATQAGAISPSPFACTQTTATQHELDAYIATLPTLEEGNRGSAVLGLQLYLTVRGYDLSTTGYFGPKTKAAVQDFQYHYGEPQDGVVGPSTWHWIIDGAGHILSPGYTNPALYPGDSMDSYAGEQVMDLGVRAPFDWFSTEHTPQVYDGRLLSSVEDFQERIGLDGSGIFGPKTTKAFIRVISIAGLWDC